MTRGARKSVHDVILMVSSFNHDLLLTTDGFVASDGEYIGEDIGVLSYLIRTFLMLNFSLPDSLPPSEMSLRPPCHIDPAHSLDFVLAVAPLVDKYVYHNSSAAFMCPWTGEFQPERRLRR